MAAHPPGQGDDGRASDRRRAGPARAGRLRARGAGDTVVEQFDAAAANLVAALRAAGGEPEDLVSLVVYATDLDEYRASLSDLGEVWRQHFGRQYPAMALIGVSALLDPMARVELMGVAVVQDD